MVEVSCFFAALFLLRISSSNTSNNFLSSLDKVSVSTHSKKWSSIVRSLFVMVIVKGIPKEKQLSSFAVSCWCSDHQLHLLHYKQ